MEKVGYNIKKTDKSNYYDLIAKTTITMKKDDNINELHLGRLIKEIAHQKSISSSRLELAFIPPRYQHNADKIFKLADLDIEDAVQICNILESNLFETISNKYLSHIPFYGNHIKYAYQSITLHFPTNHFTINRNEENNTYLENIHIGQYIKEMVEKRKWSQHYLAKQIDCKQSLINYYFKQKSMKIKPLIRISNALYYNLIAEIYLIRKYVVPSLRHVNNMIINLFENTNIAEKNEKGVFTMQFKTLEQSSWA